MSTAGSTLTTSVSSGTLVTYVQDSAHQKAEIIWAIKMCNGFSDHSTQDIVDCFGAMFPDSKITERMQLGPNKLKYVVNHGIASYIKDLLKAKSPTLLCLLMSLCMM